VCVWLLSISAKTSLFPVCLVPFPSLCSNRQLPHALSLSRPLSYTQHTHTHNHRSQTQVYLAASPTLKDEAERGAAVGGTYFSDCRPKKTTKEAEDLDAAGKLWKLSEKLTGSSFSV